MMQKSVMDITSVMADSVGYGGWCRLWRKVSVMADGVCYGGSFCRLAEWN